MGIGYWLTERVIYDQDSGQLLTHNTWVNDIVVPTNKNLFVVVIYNNYYYSCTVSIRNTSLLAQRTFLLTSGWNCSRTAQTLLVS